METGGEGSEEPGSQGCGDGMEIESSEQGINGMEIESDKVTDVPADHEVTDVAVENKSTDIPAEHIVADSPVEPKDTDVPAEPESLAEHKTTDTPVEHIAADVPAEHKAADVPAEHKATDVPVEQLPAEENRLSAEEIKHWAAVKGNPSDFSSWTVLLQLMEQKGKLGPAREVFDAFLKQYPYCYGYWKKYADFERKHSGPDTAKEVFERGVMTIPLSVDLWVHYASFTVGINKDRPNALEEIRRFFKAAVDACGLDYRSGKMWNMYIAWEQENGVSEYLLSVYDRLLATPIQTYQQHFESFKQVVESNPPSKLLSQQEYKELCEVVQREMTTEQITEEGALEKVVRMKVIERRTVVHEACKAEVEKRSHFEEGIKRPYFHVKPLERVQLKNWKEYLEFEISQGNQQRIITLFERCLIACALYEDFWTKFAKYAEEHCPAYAESVYPRACTVHLQQKPNIHIAWAAYEERRGNIEKSRDILRTIDSVVPGLVFVRLRRIGLEVRGRCHSRVEALYCESIASAQSTEARNFYAGRYARFAAKILCDHNKSTKILREVIDADSLNPTLYLRLLDVEMSKYPLIEADVEGVFELVRGSQLSEDVKQAFALRKLQFLEEFGSSISRLLEAQEDLQKLKKTVSVSRKRFTIEDESEAAKRARVDSTTAQDGTVQPVVEAGQDTQAQQWAAYQQQWGNYNYGQQGYNYQQYYQYPYQQAQQ